MRITLTLAFLLMMTQLMQAQSTPTLQFIPKKNTVFILEVTPYATYNKLDAEHRKEMKTAEFMAEMLVQMTQDSSNEELKEKISKHLENPEEIGLMLKKDVFAWANRPEDMSSEDFNGSSDALYLNAIVPVTDGKKFRKFLDELFGEKTKALVPSGNALNMVHDGTLINWNKDRLVISRSTVEPSFFEDPAEFEAKQDRIIRMQADLLGKEWSTEQSMVGDQQFQEHLKDKSDVSVWMDYSQLMPPLEEIPMEGREIIKSLIDNFGDMKLGIYGHLNKGEILLEYKAYYGDAVDNIVQETYDSKINKKIFKYIQGKNLMAMYSAHFNPEGLVDSYYDEITKALKKSKEGTLISNMIDIVDIFIDEDEIYTLWDGDIVMALTDMKVVERETRDYEYNEDTDTWDEVVSKNKEIMPIGLLAGSYGSEENVKKFIKLGVNAGALSQKAENAWSIAGAKQELGMDVYIIMNKDLLFITNDETLLNNPKGFSGKERMAKDDFRNMFAHPQYGFMDINKMAEVAKKRLEEADGEGSKMLEKMEKSLAKASEIFKRVELKLHKPGDHMISSDLRVIMTNPDANVLQTLFDLGEKLARFAPGMMSPGSSEPFMEEKPAEEKDVKKL